MQRPQHGVDRRETATGASASARLSVLWLLLACALGAPAVFAQEAAASVDAQLVDALEARLAELQQEMAALDAQPEPTLEILQTRRNEEAAGLQRDIDRVVEQIHVALTGVEEADYQSVFEAPPTDLNAEVLDFFQPFLILLRSATQQSREIDSLRRELLGVEAQRQIAEDALERLAATEASSASVPERYAEVQKLWRDRRAASEARATTLREKLAQLEEGGGDVSEAGLRATSYLRDRTWSLVLGVLASVAVWTALTLIGLVAHRARQNRRLAELSAHGLANPFLGPRSLGVPFRALRLVYRLLTVIAAIVAALAVFNARNDWLLLGFGVLVLLGMGWALLKTLPGAMDQIRLLLNLGSVQEGERVEFDGVPWRVRTLDLYSVLENPALEGADLTLPVRDLQGLHSRPFAPEEGWFPTSKGDWVLLDDDKIAQVEIQTPSIVRMRRLGGGTVVVSTPGFLDSPPMNLSDGYRVELEFGIDYSHQAEATGTVLEVMRSTLEERLPARLPEGALQNLEVEFFAAADSSLNYEVEVDLAGSAADQYEEVARILSALLVDCCNENGWGIPFPQVQVHGVGPAT